MFAPPPIQLTRAQIELAKREAKAREDEKRQNAEANTVSTRHKSLKSKRKNRPFARSTKIKVSSPIVHSDADLSPGPPSGESQWNKESEDGEDRVQLLVVPFGEQPRRAPIPPSRPARPPSELFLPSVPATVATQLPLRLSREQPSGPLPSLPTNASNVWSGDTHISARGLPASTKKTSKEAALSAALARFAIIEQSPKRRTSLPRSSTTPILPAAVYGTRPESRAGDSEDMNASGKSSGVARSNIGRLTESHGYKIPSLSNAGTTSVAPVNFEMPAADQLSVRPQRRATEGDPKLESGAVLSPADGRRKKGETISMLLDAGFFPLMESDSKRDLPAIDTHASVPAHLKYLDKELPNTPDSIMATPTEMYQRTLCSSIPAAEIRKSERAKRSPLAQISSNVKVKSPQKRSLIEDISPSQLSAIPELQSMIENSPPDSGLTTPTAPQIHLPSGSVLTVMPPEMNPWQRHIYVQGPIKLPKPTMMPSKDSVASLEQFQDVIDQVYQDALVVSRRRSDDAVVDDVCDWLDEFDFECVGFDGDRMKIEDFCTDEIQEVIEMDSVDVVEERFSTPSAKLPASPIVARKVIEMSPPQADPILRSPPVDNEEALRARGIARLAQHYLTTGISSEGKKESLTVP